MGKARYGAMPERKGGHKVAPKVAPHNAKGCDGGGEAEVSKAASAMYEKACHAGDGGRGGGGDPAMHKR